MKKNNILNIIFILFLSIQLVSFIKSFNFSNYLCFFFIGLWIIFSAIANKDYYIKNKKIIFLIFLNLIYTFTFPLIFENYVISNRYLNVFSLFFYYIVYDYNKVYKNKMSKRELMFIFCLGLSTFIKTFIALQQNGYVSRAIKSSGEISMSLLRQNIGGYEFIYFIHFFLLLLFFYFLFENKKNRKIILLLLFLLSFYLIILSNYLTALLLDIVIIGGLIFSYISKKTGIIFKTVLFIALLMAVIFYKTIFVSVIDLGIKLIGDNYNASRLEQLKDQIIYDENTDVYFDRKESIKLNISQTLKYPITGIVINKLEINNSGYLTEFGQHSFITDTFALYGIFIGIIEVYLIIYPFLEYIRNYPQLKLFILCFALDIILILFFNNIDTLLGFGAYYLLPLLIEKINSKERINENN